MQYGVKIFIMTSFKDTCYIEIQPKVQKSNKGIRIFFLGPCTCSLQVDGLDHSVWLLLQLVLTFMFHCFLIAVVLLSFWAEVHYNSIYPRNGE